MQELIEQTLQNLSIAYRLVHHQAAYTMAEMEALNLNLGCTHVKNLFLRDRKSRKFFLFCVKGDKPVNLQLLSIKLGVAGGLSFANHQQLQDKLGLMPGSVTPLGILNDEKREVTVVLDSGFTDTELVGVHPNENTASVLFMFSDLVRILVEHKTPIQYMDLK
ncbi:prolyl-tRNA synthetase associated domain-containing protein [Sphaerochaeta pleomorpha]|nr:prolyl-tRNA synthetase associated domain-containing protein [Sphaerochaeta pleomorpha]